MDPKNLPILLNIRQVSHILGVHPDTLRDWDNTGRLPAVRLGSRRDRRWRREDILKIIKKGLK
ncbi:MAG: helix-turn-helix domain-containing protein [Patescibacteria group bacterium]